MGTVLGPAQAAQKQQAVSSNIQNVGTSKHPILANK